MDNCSSQNKNCTLLSYIVYIMNSNVISAESIKIRVRHFEPEHIFTLQDFRQRQSFMLQTKIKQDEFIYMTLFQFRHFVETCLSIIKKSLQNIDKC